MKNETIDMIHQFRKARKWDEHENIKDLAISLSLEASEFLELFQWKTPEASVQNTERLQEELADVLIYSYSLADKLNFNVDEIVAKKMAKNALKYPLQEESND